MLESNIDYKEAIIAAVDLTKYSIPALLFAADLAFDTKSPLIILHVVHDPAGSPGFYKIKNKEKTKAMPMDKIAKKMLKSFLNKVAEECEHPEVIKNANKTLVTGLPETQMLNFINNKKIRVLVIGSHGKKGLSKILSGSIVDNIIKYSLVPVTVVKNKKMKKLIKKAGYETIK